jgi:hypothetical protein
MNIFLIDKLKLAENHLAIALSALEDIITPLAYLQRKAEEDGNKIDGMMAVHMIENGAILREIAQEALNKIRNK